MPRRYIRRPRVPPTHVWVRAAALKWLEGESLKGKRHATFLMWELFRLDPHAVKLMAAGRQQIAAILHRAEKDGKLPLALYKLDQGFKRLEKEFGVTASDTAAAAGSPQK